MNTLCEKLNKKYWNEETYVRMLSINTELNIYTKILLSCFTRDGALFGRSFSQSGVTVDGEALNKNRGAQAERYFLTISPKKNWPKKTLIPGYFSSPGNVTLV